MKAAIISVGTELLFGQIVNTNTVFLSKQLNNLGIDVMYHHTVGDNPKRLKEIIELAWSDCDLVITTGGLGPTQDDLTKEIICETLDAELELHQPTLDALYQYEKFRTVPLTENNFKQAYYPADAVVFSNDRGTAPGMALERDGKIAICLPGPPSEMNAMFTNKVQPYLENRAGASLYYRNIRTFGLYEAQLETMLLSLIDGQTDPTIATYASDGEVSLRVASKRATREEAKAAVDGMTEKIAEIVGDYIYSYDGVSLPEVTAKELMEKNITISSAESCTGGLFAETLTSIPGVSAVFDRGLVTYTEKAKMEELGVRKETLEKYGAVSEETAREMALGLQKVTGSDICISVTGLAGPGGGTEEKPVGLVYMGLVMGDHIEVRRICEGRKVRKLIRNAAMLNMFDMIHKNISCK